MPASIYAAMRQLTLNGYGFLPAYVAKAQYSGLARGLGSQLAHFPVTDRATRKSNRRQAPRAWIFHALQLLATGTAPQISDWRTSLFRLLAHLFAFDLPKHLGQ